MIIHDDCSGHPPHGRESYRSPWKSQHWAAVRAAGTQARVDEIRGNGEKLLATYNQELATLQRQQDKALELKTKLEEVRTQAIISSPQCDPRIATALKAVEAATASLQEVQRQIAKEREGANDPFIR